MTIQEQIDHHKKMIAELEKQKAEINTVTEVDELFEVFKEAWALPTKEFFFNIPVKIKITPRPSLGLYHWSDNTEIQIDDNLPDVIKELFESNLEQLLYLYEEYMDIMDKHYVIARRVDYNTDYDTRNRIEILFREKALAYTRANPGVD